MPRDKYVHLSDGRTLKVYKGADGSEYYKDKEEKKTLRSNQKTIFKDSAKAEEGKAPVNVAVRRVSALPSQVKPPSSSSAGVGRVPPKAPKRCPFSKDGKHAGFGENLPRPIQSEYDRQESVLASKGLVIQPGDKDVDHEIPLWDGGADCPCNMQLLSKEKHMEKTAKEATERANRAR